MSNPANEYRLSEKAVIALSGIASALSRLADSAEQELFIRERGVAVAERLAASTEQTKTEIDALMAGMR